MTSAAENTIYPIYCFELSPTITKWCHFRAADIHALTSNPGFEGQNVFFHLNHPIRWVRIAGVVVAIDEYAARRIYTVDDSSGATIECVVNIPNPKLAQLGGMTATAARAELRKQQHEEQQQQLQQQQQELQQQEGDGQGGNNNGNGSKQRPKLDGDIDVGHVIEVKGGLKVFRDAKQIDVHRVVHVKSTEQEVLFWEQIARLKRETLDRPWVISPREVRRCRKAAEECGNPAQKKKEREKERRKRLRAAGEDAERDEAGTARELQRARRRLTGLEKKPKARRPVIVDRKYGALGL